MATSHSKNTDTSEKYEVIDITKKNPLMGVCKLAEHFSCGKSQIATILKNKESIWSSMNLTYQVRASVQGKEHAPLNLLVSMKLSISGTCLLCLKTSILWVPNCVKKGNG